MFLEILIILGAVLLNGFFAASELALVSARRTRLKQLADEGSEGARVALLLAEDSGRFLSSVQIGITLIGVFAGAYGGAKIAEPLGVWLSEYYPPLAQYAQPLALAAVVALITYASLILGELVPKRVALARAETIAVAVSRPLFSFARVMSPFVTLLEVSSLAMLRLCGIHSEEAAPVTEEEVKTMIVEGTESGVFEEQEKQMIEGVLRLGDRTTRAIMTPRPDIIWLDLTADVNEIKAEIISSGYSRLPLGRGTIDEVLGIIQAKDLLNAILKGEELNLLALKHEPLIVHDGMPVLQLLEMFRTSRQQMAIVADEYGSVEGLVTLTDILEAVAGDLPEAHEDAEHEIITRDDGSYLIDAMTPIDEVEVALKLRGMREEGESFNTLAGFILVQLGHIPVAGNFFAYAGHRFEVVDMDGRRVDKVLVIPPKDAIDAVDAG